MHWNVASSSIKMTERFDALRHDEAAWAEIETERDVEHGAASDRS